MSTETKKLSTKDLAIISLMIALTIVLMFTPYGTIRLPVVSVTIAHVPAIVTAIVFGLSGGIAVALAFGISSLFVAMTAPTGILDPFFVNPLVSILPRVLIPVTTYYSYRVLRRITALHGAGEYIAIGISVAIGNLTNTFGVYTMLYLVYARQIFEKSGTPALNLIIAAVSTTTLIKCVAIVIVSMPVIFALNRAKRIIAFDL